MPMRVVGGSAGGRSLHRGAPRVSLRPTSTRVREALFEILMARDAVHGAVLDLYAGTGALGIEALSRGAERCDFVEADAKTAEVIRRNLTATSLIDVGRVWPLSVARATSRLQGPYDLVVADPPYEYDRAEQDLVALAEAGLLAPDAVIAVEHSKRRAWPETLAGRLQVLSRRYGDSAITIYRASPSE